MRPARSSLDLVATAGLALLGLVAALTPIEAWMKVAVLVPFVFVLPGYAVAAIFLSRGSVPWSERLVYTLALSVAVTVLSGILVQLAVGLDRPVWAVLLTLVTVTASIAALRRREKRTFEAPERESRPRLPAVAPGSLLAIAVAVGLAAWAVSIASGGARAEQDRTRFTQLWVLPGQRGPSGRSEVATIGVESHQGATVSYVVAASRHGDRIATWRLRLDDGERWQAALPVPDLSPADPLKVRLLRGGRLYRRAYLQSGELG